MTEHRANESISGSFYMILFCVILRLYLGIVLRWTRLSKSRRNNLCRNLLLPNFEEPPQTYADLENMSMWRQYRARQFCSGPPFASKFTALLSHLSDTFLTRIRLRDRGFKIRR